MSNRSTICWTGWTGWTVRCAVVLLPAACGDHGPQATSSVSSASSAGEPIRGLGGKCLDDSGDGRADGNKIQLWDCNGTDAQGWTRVKQTLVGPGGKCLDVRWDKQAAGTNVQLWDCNGTSAQEWTVTGSTLVSAGGFCLAVVGTEAMDGAAVQIAGCTGGANQQWTLGDASPPEAGAGGGGGDGGRAGGDAGGGGAGGGGGTNTDAGRADAAGPPTTSAGTRNWYENPGGDGTFWVQPFQTTASWITSGSLVDQLRNGSYGTPTGHVHLKGDFSTPWVIGKASDPTVTVTDGKKSIHVHVPAGTVVEEPASQYDQSIGGSDATQPYLVWSISGATINTGAVQDGSVISGSYGFQIDDGAGAIMTDAVTGQPGGNNSIGSIQDYELSHAAADPAYVMQHMLAYSLDPSQVNTQVAWPLLVSDQSFADTGSLTQGLTVGIPANTPRPSGKSRGFYLLFDNLQQFGWFYYNVSGNGCLSIGAYSTDPANQALASDAASSINDVMSYVAILGNQTGPGSLKGYAPGGTNAFPAPPPLDLSPTGGVNVAPSTFGAWYPSGYNVTP